MNREQGNCKPEQRWRGEGKKYLTMGIPKNWYGSGKSKHEIINRSSSCHPHLAKQDKDAQTD